MVRGIKSTSKKVETNIYHHGLIKLLITHEIRKQGSSWKNLLRHNFTSEGSSKSIEGNKPVDSNKDLYNRKESRKKT